MPLKIVEYLGINKIVNNTLPLVSVCVPTYQHAGYIAECLESILSQETSFSVEILVGEDQSTDGTREICISYAEKFPDKIRLFLNTRENIVFIDDRPTGRANLLGLFSRARGQFIAICEGDDYWTEKTKLEMQIAVFREHPECSLVFHNALILGGYRHDRRFSNDLVEGIYDIESVISKPWFVPTQSIVYRKELLELGGWATHSYNGDLAIQLRLAAKQPFYYVDRVMSVYRVHKGGTNWGKRVFYHPLKHIETLSIFNCESKFKYDRLIKKRLEAIRSGMLDSSSEHILMIAILNMSLWEKILTFRYYVYVIRHLVGKLK